MSSKYRSVYQEVWSHDGPSFGDFILVMPKPLYDVRFSVYIWHRAGECPEVHCGGEIGFSVTDGGASRSRLWYGEDDPEGFGPIAHAPDLKSFLREARKGARGLSGRRREHFFRFASIEAAIRCVLGVRFPELRRHLYQTTVPAGIYDLSPQRFTYD